MIRRTAAALLELCAACHVDQPAPPARVSHPSVPPRRALPTRAVRRAPRTPPPVAPAPDSAPPAHARRREPEGFPQPEHPAGYLVWTADSLHAARTVWLDTRGAVVATRPGVYIAAGSHLWQWVNARSEVEGIDCDCYQRRDSIRGCETRERVGVAYLKDLTGKAHHLQVLGADDDLTMAPPQQSAEPLSSTGPYLVSMAGGIYDGCGAHDLPGRWRATWDLSAGRPIEIADTAGVYERDSLVAVRFFEASPSGLSEDEPGPGGFEGYEFQWTRAGRLQGGYRFGVWACFACSDYPDRSYGRSVLVPDPVLPRWLRPWSRAPRVVAQYWRTDPRLRRGWSQVAVWKRTDVFSAKWWFGDGLRTGWSAIEPEHAAKMREQFAPAPAPAETVVEISPPNDG